MTHAAMRVVVDTNLVLSALVFAGARLAPWRLAWQTGRVVPLVSPATADELIHALAYPKFGLSAADRQELLADYLPYCTVVRIPSPPPATPRCRDTMDVPFLQLALAGGAAALVTGDRDLLALGDRLGSPIVDAQRFLASLASGR